MESPGQRSTTPLLSAQQLQDLFDHYDDVENRVAKITELEHRGDFIVHEVMDRVGHHTPVIAKLEKPEAVANLKGDAARADAERANRFTLQGQLVLGLTHPRKLAAAPRETSGPAQPEFSSRRVAAL